MRLAVVLTALAATAMASPSRPFLVAHRGASGYAPEHTIAAYTLAMEQGADYVEQDLTLTRDGVLVCLHDDTLERTTDGRGAVCRRTLAELRGLDAGAWFAPEFAGEAVPTLAQVLACVRLPINVELKAGGGVGLEARTLDVVRAAGALDRIVFSSFDPTSLERLRLLTADAQIGVLWSHPEISPAIAIAKRVAAIAVHIRKTAVSPESVAAAREAGLLTRVWTVNEPREFAPLERAGAAGVFTDYPERFLLL